MGLMEKFGFGKKKAADENVFVDPSLGAERLAAPEERLAAMGNEFARQSSDWNAKLERLESEKEQGASVPDAELQSVKDRANLYSKLEGAVRTAENAGGDGKAMIRAAIGYLQQYAPQSSDFERKEMEKTLRQLKEML